MNSTSTLFKQELSQGKPLFQFSVDTNTIQTLFQKLISQVRLQNDEIQNLKEELKQRPTIEQITKLESQVENIKTECTNSKELIQDNTELVKSILDERNKNMDVTTEVERALNGPLKMP